MRISRPVAITTLAAGALAGGLGGAMLLSPAGAGDSSSNVTTAAEVAPTASARCGGGLSALADTIGISVDDLRTALREGQTIAEVAEANGADPQDIIDTFVARGNERLDAAVAAGRIDQATADERKAQLPEHAADVVNGELERDVRRHPGRRVATKVAAETIGISADELRDAVRDGQTIAEVAEANGTDPQDVIDALAARSTARITKVVNGDDAGQRC